MELEICCQSVAVEKFGLIKATTDFLGQLLRDYEGSKDGMIPCPKLETFLAPLRSLVFCTMMGSSVPRILLDTCKKLI